MVLNKLLFIIYVIFEICAVDLVYRQCRFFKIGVTPRDQREILNKHNYLRYLLSNGTVPGQPKATNLKLLRYDARLAYAAQVAANTCRFSYVYPTDSRWEYIGQNMAKGGASFVNSEPEWDKAIQTWFDEYKMYRYPNAAENNTIHYLQIASAETRYVGCGYSYFLDSRYRMPSFVKLYVCYYGAGLNIANKPPYETVYIKSKHSYHLGNKCL
ncbi:hypothetical protein RN001_002781 [Aquatica leii]|uniref:SCP domain-containing protein n=1 Tax=Aquatica leii TaxID=1421715 RepID=A0AAN7PE01_9COLE|nr:hypothetical protein RN001_002781 [Aquatica leii]